MSGSNTPWTQGPTIRDPAEHLKFVRDCGRVMSTDRQASLSVDITPFSRVNFPKLPAARFRNIVMHEFPAPPFFMHEHYVHGRKHLRLMLFSSFQIEAVVTAASIVFSLRDSAEARPVSPNMKCSMRNCGLDRRCAIIEDRRSNASSRNQGLESLYA